MFNHDLIKTNVIRIRGTGASHKTWLHYVTTWLHGCYMVNSLGPFVVRMGLMTFVADWPLLTSSFREMFFLKPTLG